MNDTAVTMLLLGLLIGVVIGASAGMFAAASPFVSGDETADEEPATVSCVTYTTEDGNASGMCFISGDVRFRWLDDGQNAANWTIALDELPVENATVRREA